MSQYDEQAAEFLRKTDAIIKVVFNRQGIHFDGDKYERDIYDVTISRNNRSFTFAFGQSLNNSGRFWKYGDYRRGVAQGREWPKNSGSYQPPTGEIGMREWDKNKNFSAPDNYSILSALTKNDPGSFEDFCPEFGYDTDSRSAEKIYKAVKDEYSNLCRLFSDAEIELMQEIQ